MPVSSSARLVERCEDHPIQESLYHPRLLQGSFQEVKWAMCRHRGQPTAASLFGAEKSTDPPKSDIISSALSALKAVCTHNALM